MHEWFDNVIRDFFLLIDDGDIWSSFQSQNLFDGQIYDSDTPYVT